MYSISIYDSKQLRRKELEKTLECYFLAKGLRYRIRTYSSIYELIRSAEYVDIVFASIEEGTDVQAIDMCDALLGMKSHIYLYVMADNYNYIDRAMDLKVFRYFEHPVDRNRLFASIDIIVNKPRQISFMSEHTNVTLNEDEVVCIYTSGRKSCLLADSGVVYPATLSVKEWLEKTKEFETFVCPHYGYIVNMKYISNFSDNTITMKCKTGKTTIVYPSQRRLAEFRNRYYAFS